VNSWFDWKLKRNFEAFVLRWTCKKEKEKRKQKMPMHGDARGQIAGLDENAIQHSHVAEMLRCCDIAMLHNRSFRSPQTLGVFEGKFQHFDLLQLELKHFSKEDLVRKCELQNAQKQKQNDLVLEQCLTNFIEPGPDISGSEIRNCSDVTYC
jgi:hypothetical protein